jgi:hypothetical protein
MAPLTRSAAVRSLSIRSSGSGMLMVRQAVRSAAIAAFSAA